MKRIVTNDGRFAAGNPQTGTPGTMVTSLFMNDLQDEVVNVIEDAGLVLDDADRHQMSKAIDAKIAGSSLLVLPTTPALQTESGLIFVEDRISFMTWVTTAYYTGYRSLECGRFVWGTTELPRLNEIEAEGDIIVGANYASLVGYFKENSLVVPIANWTPGTWRLGDMGDGTYRLPDICDMFIRGTGTDIDTANPRALGSKQVDAVGPMEWAGQSLNVATGAGPSIFGLGLAAGSDWYAAIGFRNNSNLGLVETRSINTSLHPRIVL